ncbi:MAG: Glu/Leu/Phe/Val dehydrogenase [Candidatus Aenigmatarchaeota archaeon]
MEIESFADEFGPEKVVEVYNPRVGLKGILVIDSTALGPGKGGIRMTPSVTVEEVFRLARVMTWKTALADLHFGGAKSGIIADPKEISLEKKKELLFEFGKALRPFCPKYYIAGPDVNTGEEEMRWFVEGAGSLKAATGKPKDLKGLPHELGSTGYGVAISTLVACKYARLKIKDAKIAIEGFGNVGTFTFKHLAEFGGKIVAVSDSKGCVYNPEGLSFEELLKVKKETGSVINYSKGKVLKKEELFGLETDILIPAALSDSINENNVSQIKASLVVEAANIAITKKAEEELYKKGVLVVPDFVANAGGVISSYAEYKGFNEEKMFKLVERKIKKNTKLVLKRSKEKQIKPREAAIEIAKERVKKAMESK